MGHVVSGAGPDFGKGFFLVAEDREIGKLPVFLQILLVVLGGIPALPGKSRWDGPPPRPVAGPDHMGRVTVATPREASVDWNFRRDIFPVANMSIRSSFLYSMFCSSG